MRDRIVAIAAEMWAETGYHSTSLRELASAMGIKAASLYYHYPTKESLAQAVAQPLLDEIDDLLARRIDRREARLTLESYYGTLCRHRTIARLAHRDVGFVRAAGIASRVADQHRALCRSLVGSAAKLRGQLRASAALAALTAPVVDDMVGASEPLVRRVSVGAAVAILT